jgi:hypothetical protein
VSLKPQRGIVRNLIGLLPLISFVGEAGVAVYGADAVLPMIAGKRETQKSLKSQESSCVERELSFLVFSKAVMRFEVREGNSSTPYRLCGVRTTVHS